MIRAERPMCRSALVESYIVTNGLQPAVRLSAISHPNKRQRHYVRTLPINALKVLGESRGASFKKPLWRIPRNPRAPHTRMRAGNRTEGRDGGDRETKARTPLRQRQADGARQGCRELRDAWLRSGLNPSAAARRETDSPCDSLREAPRRQARQADPTRLHLSTQRADRAAGGSGGS